MTRAEKIEAALKDWIEVRNGGYESERIAYEMAMIAIAEPADPAPASVEKAKDEVVEAAKAMAHCPIVVGLSARIRDDARHERRHDELAELLDALARLTALAGKEK